VTVAQGRSSQTSYVLRIDGDLWMPIGRDLRHNIRALLRRGERDIVLDLAGVSKVDAAGIGELVRAYNMTSATDGWLRVVHTKAWVREILQRAGLFELFSADRQDVRS
jgi:anti-anti-sigma factor